MLLPSLHPPTVLVISALVVALSGCVLILARGRDQGSVPLAFWGSAMLAGAVGIVLLSLAPFTEWPARAGGNALILVGVGLSWTGARIFAGRRFRPGLVFGGVAAWLLLFCLTRNAAAAVPGVLAFVLGAAYVLAAAAELWRGRQEYLPTRRAAIVLLVAHGALYLVQAVVSAFWPAVAYSAPVSLALMLEALLHTTGMAFLFLALIKERAELRSTVQLRELATQDGLTGLANRRQFDDVFEREFQRAKRAGASLALLMIDVDQFKAFNDTYGHQAGDRCLRSVAAAMQVTVRRPADLVVRYGGEEFAVLLPKTNTAGAVEVAETIRTHVMGLRTAHAKSTHGVVTVSIGVAASIPGQEVSRPDQMLQAADRALYQAKATGRNKCCVDWAAAALLVSLFCLDLGLPQPSWAAAPPPMLTARDCGDLLARSRGKPAHVAYVGCQYLPDRQGKPLQATYHVEGRFASRAEADLVRLVGLNRLQRFCCQWSTRPKQFKDRAGHEFSIAMGSGETLVTRRSDWRRVPYFEIVVESFSEEI